ncbi:hypothetical protein HDU96_000184 [Phlyctochytrium bullatum]|nr:hypothetical protein HDU96_000184 [Phlyctochytrium bullatum]
MFTLEEEEDAVSAIASTEFSVFEMLGKSERIVNLPRNEIDAAKKSRVNDLSVADEGRKSDKPMVENILDEMPSIPNTQSELEPASWHAQTGPVARASAIAKHDTVSKNELNDTDLASILNMDPIWPHVPSSQKTLEQVLKSSQMGKMRHEREAKITRAVDESNGRNIGNKSYLMNLDGKKHTEDRDVKGLLFPPVITDTM